jgi:hypothetical protein
MCIQEEHEKRTGLGIGTGPPYALASQPSSSGKV